MNLPTCGHAVVTSHGTGANASIALRFTQIACAKAIARGPSALRPTTCANIRWVQGRGPPGSPTGVSRVSAARQSPPYRFRGSRNREKTSRLRPIGNGSLGAVTEPFDLSLPPPNALARGAERLQTRRWREVDSNCWSRRKKERPFRGPLYWFAVAVPARSGPNCRPGASMRARRRRGVSALPLGDEAQRRLGVAVAGRDLARKDQLQPGIECSRDRGRAAQPRVLEHQDAPFGLAGGDQRAAASMIEAGSPRSATGPQRRRAWRSRLRRHQVAQHLPEYTKV
jgi:hypothetical protein